MSGVELTVLAKSRGDEVHVMDDGEYELGGIHPGYGKQAGGLYQDVLSVVCGRRHHIFSINAEAGR
jgi:hypothetical protein